MDTFAILPGIVLFCGLFILRPIYLKKIAQYKSRLLKIAAVCNGGFLICTFWYGSYCFVLLTNNERSLPYLWVTIGSIAMFYISSSAIRYAAKLYEENGAQESRDA